MYIHTYTYIHTDIHTYILILIMMIIITSIASYPDSHPYTYIILAKGADEDDALSSSTCSKPPSPTKTARASAVAVPS